MHVWLADPAPSEFKSDLRIHRHSIHLIDCLIGRTLHDVDALRSCLLALFDYYTVVCRMNICNTCMLLVLGQWHSKLQGNYKMSDQYHTSSVCHSKLQIKQEMRDCFGQLLQANSTSSWKVFSMVSTSLYCWSGSPLEQSFAIW